MQFKGLAGLKPQNARGRLTPARQGGAKAMRKMVNKGPNMSRAKLGSLVSNARKKLSK